MSLNTAHLNGGVLIHAQECILLFCDNVSMEFSGQDGQEFKGTKTGRMYLTTHRMIFNAKSQKDLMQSFSFPFVTLSNVELEQPLFGANYIKGKVRAQPNGNWIGEAKFKLMFKSGGAIDFGQAMLKAAHMASRGANNDAPPPYVPPQSPWYAAPPPAYAPPSNGYYGWMPPTGAFPDAPPANSVYMTDSPPPYPGITGYAGYANTPSAPGMAGASSGFVPQPSSADAKASEAAQSAYYDPNRPQMAYVPPPAYYEQPPSYQNATVFTDIPSSWILLFCSSVFSLILFMFICVCWQSRKKSSQAYVMDSSETTRTELANNNVPQVLAQNKQKYHYHGVTYSSINAPDELANQADTFSFNILSIFRNIQRNKYSESTSDLNKVLTDNLEDSHTDTMHKNFEKSVLCLNSNDSNASRSFDKDEAFSCISDDSKTTFTSVRPIYNRSYSVADTFKSTLSDY